MKRMRAHQICIRLMPAVEPMGLCPQCPRNPCMRPNIRGNRWMVRQFSRSGKMRTNGLTMKSHLEIPKRGQD